MPRLIGTPSSANKKASFSNYRSLLGQTVTLHWKRPLVEHVHFTIIEYNGHIGFKPNGLDDRIFLNMSQAMKPFSRCQPQSDGYWFKIRTGAYAGRTLADI